MDNDQFWFLFNFRLNNFAKQVNLLKEQIRKGGHSPIVIIGHSLGGAVAAYFAEEIHTDLLVTLDPVSTGQPDGKPRYAKYWIHVYLKGDNWLMLDWQHIRGADQNLHLGMNHNDVMAMYNHPGVAGTVDAYLRCRRY